MSREMEVEGSMGSHIRLRPPVTLDLGIKLNQELRATLGPGPSSGILIEEKIDT